VKITVKFFYIVGYFYTELKNKTKVESIITLLFRPLAFSCC